jgi:hypothetical protein
MKNGDRYTIGGEHKTAFVFAAIYFVLGLLFEELPISVLILSLFLICVVLARLDFEWPLAVYSRIVHIIFFGLIILSKLNVI